MQISEMDELCECIIAAKAEIEERESAIAEIKTRVQEYFVETNRQAPYVSPNGTLYLHTEMQITMPKGNKLRDLFEHFRSLHGDEYAWQKMSIHQMTLRSELNQHRAALEEKGEDPLLAPLPGVEQPTYFKQLRFRKPRK